MHFSFENPFTQLQNQFSQNMGSSIVSRFSFLPSFRLKQFDQYYAVLNQPWVILGVAIAAVILIPRFYKQVTQKILVPFAVTYGGLLIVSYPLEFLQALKTGVDFIRFHPIVVSIAIIAVASYLLSSYILVGLVGATLYFGYTQIGKISAFLGRKQIDVEQQTKSVYNS